MAMLQVIVRDVDALVATLKAGGASIVTVAARRSTSGRCAQPSSADPNNLFLELIQRPPQ